MMDGTVAGLSPLSIAFTDTTEYWNSRMGAIPFFGVNAPYRYFAANKSRLYVLDANNGTQYVNGELKSVTGLTPEKNRLLKLIAQAHLAYWVTSTRVKRTCRVLAVAYAVTAAYTDGLWKDVLYPACEVSIDCDWREIDQENRVLNFRLKVPTNYVGAITEYTVQDRRFLCYGASFTARTIEPCYKQIFPLQRVRSPTIVSDVNLSYQKDDKCRLKTTTVATEYTT